MKKYKSKHYRIALQKAFYKVTENAVGVNTCSILVLAPVLLKLFNWAKSENAQGKLYSQLSDLVQQKQRTELDEMYVHRNVLQEQVFELRAKVESFNKHEETIDLLKKRLDHKDEIIAQRDARISQLMEELLKMKDRVHSLEIRLKADEAKFAKDVLSRKLTVRNTFLRLI